MVRAPTGAATGVGVLQALRGQLDGPLDRGRGDLRPDHLQRQHHNARPRRLVLAPLPGAHTSPCGNPSHARHTSAPVGTSTLGSRPPAPASLSRRAWRRARSRGSCARTTRSTASPHAPIAGCSPLWRGRHGASTGPPPPPHTHTLHPCPTPHTLAQPPCPHTLPPGLPPMPLCPTSGTSLPTATPMPTCTIRITTQRRRRKRCA